MKTTIYLTYDPVEPKSDKTMVEIIIEAGVNCDLIDVYMSTVTHEYLFVFDITYDSDDQLTFLRLTCPYVFGIPEWVTNRQYTLLAAT